MRDNRHPALIFALSIVLGIAVFTLYFQVTDFDFINFDDPSYVLENPLVNKGVSFNNIMNAFISFDNANWHPLTWVSHMVDVELFGLNPGMHHLVNVFIHLANSILLLLVFFLMTGAPWRSFILAALFAVHPLHVESVAWISERKDVLSTFFWFATMLCYWWYVTKRTASRYLLVVAAYVLGILSKPMVVTLPVILILLDFWPLQRIYPKDTLKDQWRDIKILMYEKIPLFILSAVSSGMTFYAQQKGQAVVSLENINVILRIENAIISYVVYIEKAILPFNLSIYYTYSAKMPFIWVSLCAIFSILMTVFSFIKRSSRPYLVTGWLWYVITLVPVIGIVQVGSQASADRYTYIPLIGIFFLLIWGVSDKIQTSKPGRVFFSVLTLFIIAAFMRISWVQIGYWKDSETLFRHALISTPDNHIAHFQYGRALSDKGKYPEAIKEYFEAIRIAPTFADVYVNLANLMLRRGFPDESIIYSSKALTLNSKHKLALINMGMAYSVKGNLPKAIEFYNKYISENPDGSDIPSVRKARDNAKIILERQDREIAGLKNSIMENKQDPIPPLRLAKIYMSREDFDAAAIFFQKALLIDPRLKDALNGLVSVYSANRNYAKALEVLQQILSFEKENPNVYYDIACIYSLAEQPREAIKYLQKALSKGFQNKDLIRKDPHLENLRQSKEGTHFLKELSVSSPDRSENN